MAEKLDLKTLTEELNFTKSYKTNNNFYEFSLNLEPSFSILRFSIYDKTDQHNP